jgi:anti-sigma B factor antagonist
MDAAQSSAHDAHGPETIAFRGELDLFNLDLIGETIDAAVEGPAATLVVDLSEVTFIDSTVLGAFVTAFAKARVRGTRVVFVVDADEPIHRALQIAGLDRFFAVAERSSA